jgi:hypothetical protein
MGNLTAPPGRAIGSANQQNQRIGHGTMLRVATAPLRLRDTWQAHVQRAAYKSGGLVRTDRDGQLVALKDSDKRDRFLLAVDADEHLDAMPERAEIGAVLDQLDKEIDTKPPLEEYQLLVGVLLDGLAIKAGDDCDGFQDALSYCLEYVEPGRDERRYKTPKHIPIAALAGAVEELLRTFRATYGRPPPIADVVDLSRKHRLRLCAFRDDMIGLWNTRQHLIQISNASSADEDEPAEGAWP